MQLDEYALSNKKMKLYDYSDKINLSLTGDNNFKLNRNQISHCNYNQLTNNIFISTDKTIRLYKFTKESFELVNTFKGHSRSINCFEIVDNKILISGSNDCTIKCWRIDDTECISTLRGHEGSVYCLSVIKSCGYLLSTSYDDTMRIWNIDLSICVRVISNLTCAFLCIGQSVDKELLFFGTNTKAIQIWKIDQDKSLLTKSLVGHEGFVSCLEVLKEKLISGSKDFTIKIWILATGKCEKTLRGHKGIVTLLKSLSKIELASSSEDKTIKIWCLKSYVCLKTLSLTECIGCLDLTPLGELICFSSNYFKIWLLNNDEHKKFCISTNFVNYKCVTKVFYS